MWHVHNIIVSLISRFSVASTPGRTHEEGWPRIDCLRMRRIFRVFSSKIDHKLNPPRRARTFEVKGEHIQYYNMKSLRWIYDYQVFRVILCMRKQSIPGPPPPPPPRGWPGVEARFSGEWERVQFLPALLSTLTESVWNGHNYMYLHLW